MQILRLTDDSQDDDSGCAAQSRRHFRFKPPRGFAQIDRDRSRTSCSGASHPAGRGVHGLMQMRDASWWMLLAMKGRARESSSYSITPTRLRLIQCLEFKVSATM